MCYREDKTRAMFADVSYSCEYGRELTNDHKCREFYFYQASPCRGSANLETSDVENIIIKGAENYFNYNQKQKVTVEELVSSGYVNKYEIKMVIIYVMDI